MGTARHATAGLCLRVDLDKTGIQHSEDWFRGRDGTRLFTQTWEPHGSARGVMLVVHGLFEHSGRYGNLVDYIVPRGSAVYSFDQRGHGRSEGLRGYVRRRPARESRVNRRGVQVCFSLADDGLLRW